MIIDQSEGVMRSARNGLLNPCARLLVGLAHLKVSSFFFLSFRLSSFLRRGARASAREICLGATLGGGPGLGSEWAQGGLGGLAVGLQWACGGLGGLLVGLWLAFGLHSMGFLWAFGWLLVGFWWAFGRLSMGFWLAFGWLVVGL